MGFDVIYTYRSGLLTTRDASAGFVVVARCSMGVCRCTREDGWGENAQKARLKTRGWLLDAGEVVIQTFPM